MKKYSIWLSDINDTREPILKEDIQCDVLIIGAGMTGISTAYHLKNKNLKVVVVDKNEIGKGISARTTGKITYLQETIYSDLEKMYSEEVAKKYFYSQQEAIQIIKQTIEKNNINCNLEQVISYIYSNQKGKIKKERELLQKFGQVTNLFKYHQFYVLGAENTYVFHPLKYLFALKEICKKEGIQFYEHTNINDLKKDENWYICRNELVQIKAKQVVFACHYPYFLFPFLMPLKCTLERSYLSASLVKKTEPYSAIRIEKPNTSIRFYHDQKDYMIYLFNSHPLYTKYNAKENFDELVAITKEKELSVRYLWSNHDIMTFDKLPLIGRLDTHLFLATGYNTWGMTNGNLAGKMIADMVLDLYSPYETLFSPTRHIKKWTIPKAMYSGMKPMIENKLWKNKSWDPDNVYFETRNGKNIAIYVDKLGKEHIVYNTCPHLKCSLLFNSVEKTWDCPCHGSRFDLDGKVLIGPSNYNITYHKKNHSK